MKILTTVAVVTVLSSLAVAQPITGPVSAPGSAVEAPASPPAPFVVPVPPTNSVVAVTAELTVGSVGVGPEVGLDFGYGGLSAGIAVLPFFGWRSYAKARVQNKGPLAFYGAVGFVYSEDEHDVHTLFDAPPVEFGMDYIETYSAVMFEGGVKLQRGSTILRAFVGADLELSSYCSPSDCAATPVFGGIAIGVALK